MLVSFLSSNELVLSLIFSIQGESGGCGFCPPALPGAQGDRGTQGYRGRPGVS